MTDLSINSSFVRYQQAARQDSRALNFQTPLQKINTKNEEFLRVEISAEAKAASEAESTLASSQSTSGSGGVTITGTPGQRALAAGSQVSVKVPPGGDASSLIGNLSAGTFEVDFDSFNDVDFTFTITNDTFFAEDIDLVSASLNELEITLTNATGVELTFTLNNTAISGLSLAPSNSNVTTRLANILEQDFSKLVGS